MMSQNSVFVCFNLSLGSRFFQLTNRRNIFDRPLGNLLVRNLRLLSIYNYEIQYNLLKFDNKFY